jgi:hypothetical protein
MNFKKIPPIVYFIRRSLIEISFSIFHPNYGKPAVNALIVTYY